MRTVPTPARTKALAWAVPRAPQPMMTAFDCSSFSCPSPPIGEKRICREYFSELIGVNTQNRSRTIHPRVKMAGPPRTFDYTPGHAGKRDLAFKDGPSYLASGNSSLICEGGSGMQADGCMEGKRVLVTGAGTGIGRGVALEFAREGAAVALHYGRDRSGAES